MKITVDIKAENEKCGDCQFVHRTTKGLMYCYIFDIVLDDWEGGPELKRLQICKNNEYKEKQQNETF